MDFRSYLTNLICELFCKKERKECEGVVWTFQFPVERMDYEDEVGFTLELFLYSPQGISTAVGVRVSRDGKDSLPKQTSPIMLQAYHNSCWRHDGVSRVIDLLGEYEVSCPFTQSPVRPISEDEMKELMRRKWERNKRIIPRTNFDDFMLEHLLDESWDETLAFEKRW